MAVLVTFAVLSGTVPRGALAQETAVAVNRTVLADRLFTAQLQSRQSGTGRIVDLALSAELLEWRRRNTSATAQQIADRLTSRRSLLNAALTPQDRGLREPDFAIRAVGVLVASDAVVVRTAPHVQALLKATLVSSVGPIDTREDVTNGALRTLHWLRSLDTVEGGAWMRVRRTALNDAAFAQAWNSVVGSPLGVDARASFDTLKNDPILRAYVDVDALLARQGSRSDYLAEANRQFERTSQMLLQKGAESRERLREETADCPAVAGTSCTEENKAEAKKRAKEIQEKIDGAVAAGKALGTLVGMADPATGKQLTTIVTALGTIATAINTYATAVAGRGLSDAVFSLATLSMTGSVFGAVMTLVSLFGDSGGPTMDQLILEQVQMLRREVRALHEEMRASFERIDAKLDAIFGAMMTEFAKLEAAVAGNTELLVSIQNELAELGLRMEELAATILQAIGDAELHDARSDINRYIGYRETYGQPIPTYGEYTQPENEFHLTATETAKHAAFVVSPTDSRDPVTVLDTHGEAKSIGYLAKRAKALDPDAPDPAQAVAHPGVWNLGAQSYAHLQLQNPGYARQVNPDRSRQIASTGRHILDVASSFSRPGLPDSTGDRTNQLFESLTADYRAAVLALGAASSSVRTDKIKVRVEADGTTEKKSYSLFGSASQWVPDPGFPVMPSTIPVCGSSSNGISRPSNAYFGRLSRELRLAFYAYAPTLDEKTDVPEVDVCYTAAWTSTRRVNEPDGPTVYGKLRLGVAVRFRWSSNHSWSTVWSASHRWSEEIVSGYYCTDYKCYRFSKDAVAEVKKRWPGFKSTFEKYSGYTSSSLVTEARTVMTRFLQGRQRALYYYVQKYLGTKGTALQQAAQKMSTAGRLLQAYTRLGFPIALETDDILSSLLFGRYAIPLSSPAQPQVLTAYQLALGTYTCTDPIGERCTGGPYNPMAAQPYFESPCSISGVPGLPGDPVGNCLVASAIKRLDALSSRYRVHFQQVADGAVVERLPWVSSTVAALPVVDAMVR